MTQRDVLAVVGMIAGLGGSSALTGFGDAVDALAPGWGRKAIAVMSLAAFGAGLILRTQTTNANVAIAATTGAPCPTSSQPS